MASEIKMADNPVLFPPIPPLLPSKRTYLPHINHLETMNDKKLFKRYRFNRDSIYVICDLLREDLERATTRSHALSAEVQVLIALRFYASGAFLEVIGDTFNVDKATVSRVVLCVSELLHGMANDFIIWPEDDEEKKLIQRGFYEISRFPKILGCIDCTHVRIIRPTRPDDAMQALEFEEEEEEEEAEMPPMPNYEAAFVNRKGFHSINVQAVCDHRGIVILNIQNSSSRRISCYQQTLS